MTNVRFRRLLEQLKGSKASYVAVVLGLVLLPFLFSPLLANEVVVFAIFTVGYNLLLGYGGELSFGHAGLIAIGGYGLIFSLKFLSANFYLALLVALLAGGVLGVFYAGISLRRRGIYFAMITLALAQMIFFLTIFFKDFTGGQDGIAPPPAAEISSSLGPFEPTTSDLHLYVLSLILLLFVWLAVYRIVNSPFGRSLVAIRENEERAVHLGYKPNHFLIVAFTLSGAISGLAGGLYAMTFVYVTSGLAHWTTSGDVVLMALLGGVGTLGGPIVGAGAFVIISDTLVEITGHWEIVFGTIVMAVVLFAPGGIVELYDRFRGDHDGGGTDIRTMLMRLRNR